MSWWPWQSGKTRNRTQKAESLDRRIEATTRQLDAASAENRKAVVETKEAIERRFAQAAPLRPILKQLIERLSDDHYTGKDAR